MYLSENDIVKPIETPPISSIAAEVLETIGCEILLQKIIDDSLKGLFKRKSNFIGHITIARVKRFHGEVDFMKLLGELEINKLKINVSEFFLKSSVLTKTGAVYKNLEKYDLV